MFSPCSSWRATLSLDVARSAGPDNIAVAKVRKIPKAAVYKPDPIEQVQITHNCIKSYFVSIVIN